MESCSVCRFYFKVNGDETGACRKHPPQLFMMHQPSHPSPLEINGHMVMTPSKTGFLSQFPPVKGEGWCGEFEQVKRKDVVVSVETLTGGGAPNNPGR